MCDVINQVVSGEKKCLVPVLKRKVRYQKYVNKKDRNGENTQVFVGEPTEGWEVVHEASTTTGQAVQLSNDYEDVFEPEVKTVYVRVSNKVFLKEKEKKEDNSQNYFGSYFPQ